MQVLTFAPLVGFAALSMAFVMGMSQSGEEARVGYLDRPLPVFDQPPMTGRSEGFTSADLDGQVSLVNFFASWCSVCRVEHPVLLDLAATQDVPLYGLNWKDARGAGKLYLTRSGDPYTATADDSAGMLGDALGVTGVPETYVVDTKGRLRYRHIGPITPEIWEDTIQPLIAQLEEEA